jgi:hypothetical protein
MPRLLDYLSSAYAWLAMLDPSLPRALFVALVFFTIWLIRQLAPNKWEAFANLVGVKTPDMAWWHREVRALWQMLPAAIIGTLYGFLGTGDPWEALRAGGLGLLAPFAHRVAKQYKGRLGDGKPPSGTAKPLGRAVPAWNDLETPPNSLRLTSLRLACAALLLVGCSQEAAKSAADELAAQLKDPCSDASFASLTGKCAASAATCMAKGGTEAECGAICDGAADDWRLKCQ